MIRDVTFETPKNRAVLIRLSPEVYVSMSDLAKEKRVSLSRVVNRLLAEAVKEYWKLK